MSINYFSLSLKPTFFLSNSKKKKKEEKKNNNITLLIHAVHNMPNQTERALIRYRQRK
jgi:hypothetical protein